MYQLYKDSNKCNKPSEAVATGRFLIFLELLMTVELESSVSAEFPAERSKFVHSLERKQKHNYCTDTVHPASHLNMPRTLDANTNMWKTRKTTWLLFYVCLTWASDLFTNKITRWKSIIHWNKTSQKFVLHQSPTVVTIYWHYFVYCNLS
jgi:hypothetical protein